MDYHRMVNMEGPLGNVTPTYWWKSPRWIVIRIEALTVVAIIISFFLAAFGPCRRWSNRWIVQKGFFIVQVLSLSLGTYSIGLMQSSSVKSEMYPIWTVSLFALFGCIDPVTTYNGLDYKGPLSKVVYGICLKYGYVMVISIPTISSAVGKAAIITLSAITFIKGFHRSFALVQQNKIRDMVYTLRDDDGETCVIKKDEYHDWDIRQYITVDLDTGVSQLDIEKSIRNNKDKRLQSCYDVCVALCLSHKLQRHILGLEYRMPFPETLTGIDFEWALKVIEIELALVYDSFFTSNPFLHYYQAKTSSFWGLASLAGICFVMVATAIPEGMARRSGASGGCSKVVGTTTADLAITFCILVSLALLQLTQLVWSWTSNWARAAVASSFSFEEGNENEWGSQLGSPPWRHLELSGWMRLKVFVATSTNLFDKYLWQDKIGQCLMLPEPRLLGGRNMKVISYTAIEDVPMLRRPVPLVQTLGLHYIWQVIEELLSTKKTGGVKLDEDVKVSVIDFLGQLDGGRLDRNWLSSLPEEPEIRYFLPQLSAPQLLNPEDHCYRYMSCLMTWHIATWYCELAEQKSKQAEAPIRRPGNNDEQAAAGGGGGGGGGAKTRDHQRVANALSQYCAYLVKSAPELLPGPAGWAKHVYDGFARHAKVVITTGWDREDINTMCGNLSDPIFCVKWNAQMDFYMKSVPILNSMALAKQLMHGRSSDELWKTLALVWVQLLVYAAPYGNVESHMRRLSQGGEFITHLWALLYHLNIREWKVIQVENNLHDISTIEDAQRILNNDDHDLDIVVFFVVELDRCRDDIVTVSRLVDGVEFYLTSSAAVAECLFPESFTFTPGNYVHVLFLHKADKKITFYDSLVYEREYEPSYVARFLYERKLASAKARAQETAPSTSHNLIPTEELRLEDGQTEGEIIVEIQPDFSNYTFGLPPTLHTPPAYQKDVNFEAYYHSLDKPPTQMPADPQNLVATIQEWEIPSTTPSLGPVNTRRATPYPTTRNTDPNAAPPQTQATRYGVGGVPEPHEVEVPSVLDAVEEDNLEVNDNLHDISTIEDAQRIFNDDNHDLDIVVFFADSVCPDGFVAVSKLVHGVKFYFTSSRDVAMCLYFPASILQSSKSLLFLNKADKKITFYDRVVNGSYTPWNVAQFVYENKLASAKARAQETAPSTSHTPIPVEEQRSEDGQTSTVVEIEEEIPPPS